MRRAGGRCALAVGSATFTSALRRSFQQLGIHSGQELYALIKAVSFDQQRRYA
jgi:ABC-type molybdate transport system ATPase subunit